MTIMEVFTDTVKVRSPSTTELTDSEKKILAWFAKLGLEYLEHSSSAITFIRAHERMHHHAECKLGRDDIPFLLEQIDDDLLGHPTSMGFMVPSRGFAEIVIRDYRWPKQGISDERLLRLPYDKAGCSHDKEGRRFLSLPFDASPERATRDDRVHLVNEAGGPCIELSNASPLAMALYGPTRVSGLPLLLTVKIDYCSSMTEQALINKVDELIRSLVYELDIRNGKLYGISTRPLVSDVEPFAHPRVKIDKIRYPEIKIRREVADLFNFAGHVWTNRPLAFLSYYQTLEYFMPIAVRQDVFRKIRGELKDPTFDRDNDECVLRIIGTIERGSRLTEADQLRTLVRDYARRDRLEEFFAIDWGNHFTKLGPIYGAEPINLENRSKDLCDQISDRIYRIRNRIVHAKDDPRYEDARVLLPRSQEAEALGPDIELVRLLATEAILAARLPN
jgi:hypothetical protein